MCCFSQPVETVSDTNIFARGVGPRQVLVYSMTYAAAADLAMVLPLPVPPNPAEDAVRFVNLERYPEFFADLRSGFPVPVTRSWDTDAMMVALPGPALRVHDVGSFEASFVPRVADFDRLDERFRIPRAVWDRLPAYRDYGFAVFKLKGTGTPATSKPTPLSAAWFTNLFRPVPPKPPEKPPHRDVHPMAFEFPRRNPDLLYFPTVHIHDREVHPVATFDHMLYCQPEPGADEYLGGWEQSAGPAAEYMNVARAAGVIDPGRHCWRRPLNGWLQNVDSLVGRGGFVPHAP